MSDKLRCTYTEGPLTTDFSLMSPSAYQQSDTSSDRAGGHGALEVTTLLGAAAREPDPEELIGSNTADTTTPNKEDALNFIL